MSTLRPGCKVEYFDWESGVPAGTAKIHEGFELVSKGLATFQTYGQSYETTEFGVGIFTTAVIMLEDGSIENVPIENIKFISGPEFGADKVTQELIKLQQKTQEGT